MVDLVRAEVRGHQVVHIASLATVGTELERAEATAGAELVEHTEVGVGVVHPVRVWGIVGGGPVVRRGQRVGEVLVLGARLVVHAVNACETR